MKKEELKAAVVSLDQNPLNFERLALEVFYYQYQNNFVYQSYIKSLKRKVENIDRIEKIPFLPIEFFKTHKVFTDDATPQIAFESSGTTAQQTSKHFVSDLPFYELMSKKTFERFYGPLTDYHIFALLPSYLERNNSSLVYMVQNFIFHSYSNLGGFYLDDAFGMIEKMKEAAKDKRKILLIGVSFALLDLVEHPVLRKTLGSLAPKLILMETGGMKGRRKEMIREELHGILCEGFGVAEIHSEYGMTELLSQGYSLGKGDFVLPPHLKVLLREINDPFSYLPSFALGDHSQVVKYRGKSGGINVIDLVNIESCSFIETKDLGSFSADYKYFKVLGRFDNSDLRGCNLMVN
jgi:hypothetical protein